MEIQGRGPGFLWRSGRFGVKPRREYRLNADGGFVPPFKRDPGCRVAFFFSKQAIAEGADEIDG